MTTTVTGLFSTYEAAAKAVGALETAGVPHNDISIVAHQNTAPAVDVPYVPPAATLGALPLDPMAGAPLGSMTMGAGAAVDPTFGDNPRVDDAATGAGAGAGVGAVLGGGAGLLAGLGLLAIPGLGPVVAAGWLASMALGAAAGAAGGGIVGSLTGAGLGEDEAHVYAEGVRRGGTLVTAKVADEQVAMARSILADHDQVDPVARGAAYKAEGWTRFDPTSSLLSSSDVERERSRF